jgi:dihydropteroate synthase
VVAEVRSELAGALDRAEAAGIERGQTLLDPGIGFGKTYAQNLELLRRLDALGELGRPLVVGASRKAFLGRVAGEPAGAPPSGRLAGSLAAAAWAAAGGAALVRVHDAGESARFLRVWTAVRDAGGAREEAA